MKTYRSMLGGMALMAALVACGGQTTADLPQVAPAPATGADATSPSSAADSVGSTPADSVAGAPPAAVKVRTALEATDPTTVVLGAGKPQLVEFFAFW